MKTQQVAATVPTDAIKSGSNAGLPAGERGVIYADPSSFNLLSSDSRSAQLWRLLAGVRSR